MKPTNFPSNGFTPWREEVNRLLLRDYYVDLGMAGIEDEFLQVHFNMKQEPADFIEWFAIKYDLHDFKWGLAIPQIHTALSGALKR